jgi:hypothetical protein
MHFPGKDPHRIIQNLPIFLCRLYLASNAVDQMFQANNGSDMAYYEGTQ